MNHAIHAPHARLLVQLTPGVSLKEEAGGVVSARFDGEKLLLGKLTAGARRRAVDLEAGLQLFPPRASDAPEDKEISDITRRLALHGLVEYRLVRASDGADIVIVEPQMRDYAPNFARLDEGRKLVLSRFACMRRRGQDMVLESPRANAAFRLCDAAVASVIAGLSKPKTLAALRAEPGFPGPELLALLCDSQLLFAPDPDKSLRASEGDEDLVRWDFHDLQFHVRSSTGRHANPTGGLYAHAHLAPQPPAVRPAWPGAAIDLTAFGPADSAFASLLRARRSDRVYDDQNPITLAQLARLLDGAARIISRKTIDDEPGESPPLEIAARPYPSGGASYELELYLAVEKCEGLPRGFYHYDALRHALVGIGVTDRQLGALVDDGQFAMGAPRPPQILITLAARFGRVSWKYSGFAYSLILKHVGVVMQTIYLMATEMELGACAIGVGDIDLFARMTGLPFHVEGAVGHMAIGSRVEDDDASDGA